MKETAQATVIQIRNHSFTKRELIIGVGIATIFFGFAAGAIVNWYLLAIQSPLVTQFRSTLNYVSAIVGDGILLPIVNMVIMAFLLRYKASVTKRIVYMALFFGGLITAYFHISQAVNKLVNWTMPEPWQWNILGVWHACYMFAVTFFISLFYLIAFRVTKKSKSAIKDIVIVTLGLVIFLILLRLDYVSVSFSDLIPRW